MYVCNLDDNWTIENERKTTTWVWTRLQGRYPLRYVYLLDRFENVESINTFRKFQLVYICVCARVRVCVIVIVSYDLSTLRLWLLASTATFVHFFISIGFYNRVI